MRTLSLGYLSLADVGPMALVEAAGLAGFASVGVRLTARRPTEPWGHAAVSDRAARRALAAALSDKGLALSNVSAYHLYPEVTLDQLKPAVEAAAELGGKSMIACVYRDADAALVDLLGRYAELAGDAGLRIAVEAVSYSGCPTLDVARRVLREVGSPVLGLMLDPLHLQRGGSELAALSSLSADEICIAQLCDAKAKPPAGVDAATEARTMRLYPGDGELPLETFVKALPPSTEIELEVPALEHRSLPAPERARLIRSRCLDWLAGVGVQAR